MSYLSTSPTTVTDSITPNTFASSSKSVTRVFLVRHGRTNFNEQGRYQGSSDLSVLTDRGSEDAYATGLALKQFNFDAIYSSPLARVQQTTQAIVSVFDQSQGNLAPILIEPKLTEICMSDWQGLTYDEVEAKFPDAYRCWQTTPHLFSFDGAEFPVINLFQAAESFWQSILTRHRGQTILIVAHGGTNRALISTAIGIKAKHYHSLQQSNCGISCLEFVNGDRALKEDATKGFLKDTASHMPACVEASSSPQVVRDTATHKAYPKGNRQQVELSYLNVTNHLQERLPKLKAGKTGWRWLFISNSVTEGLLADSDLPELIAENLVNLVVTDNSQASEDIASQLLQNHRQTVHLSVARSGFLETWQRRIFNQQKVNSACESACLTTGLIIASDKLLHDILAKTLGVNAKLNTLKHLSVVHYPHGNCQSILQGITPLSGKFTTSLT